MVNKRSPAAREQRRLRAVKAGYVSPLPAGHRFILVPEELASRGHAILKSICIHRDHEMIMGQPYHYARHAAAAVRNLDRHASVHGALCAHRRANRAKHGSFVSRTAPFLAGGDCCMATGRGTDPLQQCDPWAKAQLPVSSGELSGHQALDPWAEWKRRRNSSGSSSLQSGGTLKKCAHGVDASTFLNAHGCRDPADLSTMVAELAEKITACQGLLAEVGVQMGVISALVHAASGGCKNHNAIEMDVSAHGAVDTAPGSAADSIVDGIDAETANGVVESDRKVPYWQLPCVGSWQLPLPLIRGMPECSGYPGQDGLQQPAESGQVKKSRGRMDELLGAWRCVAGGDVYQVVYAGRLARGRLRIDIAEDTEVYYIVRYSGFRLHFDDGEVWERLVPVS